MEFSKEITIDQPLSRVLELLDDPDHIKHWQSGLVGITRLSGSPGQPGARSTLVYNVNGREFELVETVITHNPPEELIARYETKGMVHTISNRLSAAGDRKTRMLSKNEIRFTGFMKAMGPLMANSLRKQAEQNLENLKIYLETGEDVPRG